jgi:hypothetical protein
MFGFKVSQVTVSRYMPTSNRRQGQSWWIFLRIHVIAFSHQQNQEQLSGAGYLAASNRDKLIRLLQKLGAPKHARVAKSDPDCGSTIFVPPQNLVHD